MRRILIVGGGYAGFYTAWGLEKRLRPEEAELTIIDPRPYMTYQPFLPEVAAGSVEARHAAGLTAVLGGRDIVSLASVQHPRQAFVSGGLPDAR